MRTSTLLLVDNRPQTLQYRKETLEPFGFAVITANSVPSALSTLEKTPVSAVLVEYKSEDEDIDAEAVAYQIKQRYPRQPVVLLSAYSAMPEGILWLVDEYVMRGEPLEALVKALERVTHTKEFRKANQLVDAAKRAGLPGRAIA